MTNKIVFSEILQMCLKIPKLVRQKDHKKKKNEESAKVQVMLSPTPADNCGSDYYNKDILFQS